MQKKGEQVGACDTAGGSAACLPLRHMYMRGVHVQGFQGVHIYLAPPHGVIWGLVQPLRALDAQIHLPAAAKAAQLNVTRHRMHLRLTFKWQ